MLVRISSVTTRLPLGPEGPCLLIFLTRPLELFKGLVNFSYIRATFCIFHRSMFFFVKTQLHAASRSPATADKERRFFLRNSYIVPGRCSGWSIGFASSSFPLYYSESYLLRFILPALGPLLYLRTDFSWATSFTRDHKMESIRWSPKSVKIFSTEVRVHQAVAASWPGGMASAFNAGNQ